MLLIILSSLILYYSQSGALHLYEFIQAGQESFYDTSAMRLMFVKVQQCLRNNRSNKYLILGTDNFKVCWKESAHRQVNKLNLIFEICFCIKSFYNKIQGWTETNQIPLSIIYTRIFSRDRQALGNAVFQPLHSYSV